MLGPSTEHVASGGAVQCGWRQRAMSLEACRECPFFQAYRVGGTAAAKIEVILCREPVLLA